MKPLINSAYDNALTQGDVENIGYIDCQAAKDGKTHQSFRDETDINIIVAKYDMNTLAMLAEQRGPGQYMDVSEIGDYREAMTRVAAATGIFAQLHADVRKEFDNDPAIFLDFMTDPANEDRAIAMGFIPPKEAPPAPPAPVPAANEPPKEALKTEPK